MKENNEVVIAEKDTKRLNAGIAIIALRNMHHEERLSDNQLEKYVSLSERMIKTDLYKYGEEQDQDAIQQTFVLIEEYLKEQGV